MPVRPADAEEEAPASHLVTETPASAEEGAPVGPSETEESAFLAEQRLAEPAGGAGPAAAAAAAEEEQGDLPPLDDLVQRIPPATRELIDELFRAKFITVKRVPKATLKG